MVDFENGHRAILIVRNIGKARFLRCRCAVRRGASDRAEGKDAENDQALGKGSHRTNSCRVWDSLEGEENAQKNLLIIAQTGAASNRKSEGGVCKLGSGCCNQKMSY